MTESIVKLVFYINRTELVSVFNSIGWTNQSDPIFKSLVPTFIFVDLLTYIPRLMKIFPLHPHLASSLVPPLLKYFLSSSYFSSSSNKTTTPYFLKDSFWTGRVLTNEKIEKLMNLENFVHFQSLKFGFQWVPEIRP